MTFGPNEALGIAISADGDSRVTSIGMTQGAVWIHRAGKDQAITPEAGHVRW